MLTLPEFVEFLNYTKEQHPEIYHDITQVRQPLRAEWIDADFKVKDKELYINSNHVYENGNLVPRTKEVLDKKTLMEDRTPGIFLEDWMNNSHTSQGLPNKSVKKGDLYYWCPRRDDNSVAGFVADGGGGSDLETVAGILPSGAAVSGYALLSASKVLLAENS